MRKETDFLVLGSGIAGLTFALKAAEKGKVMIMTKARADESNTKYAQEESPVSCMRRIHSKSTSGIPSSQVPDCAGRTWSAWWSPKVPSGSARSSSGDTFRS